MTNFKFIDRIFEERPEAIICNKTEMDNTTKILLEIAYQLKRIADVLSNGSIGVKQ